MKRATASRWNKPQVPLVTVITPCARKPILLQQATIPTARGEEWAEDESQDIQFDDIVSGIVRDVTSRAPPTPRNVRELSKFA